MTQPNWSLLGGNNALNMFQYGAQLGTQRRQEGEAREDRNALLQMRQQELDQRTQDRQQQQAQQQQQQRRADLPLMERLLTMAQDEPSYQQARQVAGQYGIDVSGLPPTFDPAWRNQQLQTVKALNTPQGQEALSTAGKQAMDMGYRPGTAEFTQITRQLVEAALAQPYTGSQGETRLYTPQIGQQGQAPPASPQQQQQPLTFEMYRGAVNGLGPQGAAAWLQRTNQVIAVTSPDEAEQLPSGTRILLPDGSPGVVP